jgi:hypothetical protein
VVADKLLRNVLVEEFQFRDCTVAFASEEIRLQIEQRADACDESVSFVVDEQSPHGERRSAESHGREHDAIAPSFRSFIDAGIFRFLFMAIL